MKFIKGFSISSSGIVEEAWYNMSLIKSYKITDCHIRKTDSTLKNVYQLDMGQENTDKCHYINGNVEMEIKDAADVFFRVFENKQTAVRRGRPPKSIMHVRV